MPILLISSLGLVPPPDAVYSLRSSCRSVDIWPRFRQRLDSCALSCAYAGHTIDNNATAHPPPTYSHLLFGPRLIIVESVSRAPDAESYRLEAAWMIVLYILLRLSNSARSQRGFVGS
ncbi:hypothetical protein B0H12DRAFT_747324 [Mycena haematopus]|nr:hypothetical protein B0H12DRAFT_747324 [Mycena haematopus]